MMEGEGVTFPRFLPVCAASKNTHFFFKAYGVLIINEKRGVSRAGREAACFFQFHEKKNCTFFKRKYNYVQRKYVFLTLKSQKFSRLAFLTKYQA